MTAIIGSTCEGMDNAGDTSSGVVSEDGTESVRSTSPRGAPERPIGEMAKLHSRILAICRPAGEGMQGRVAGPIGSNTKDSAEIVRPAIEGNAIQIIVSTTITRQARYGALSVDAGSER